MSRIRSLFLGAALAVSSAAAPVPAEASARYFGTVEGTWKGGGSIVAGKYKGTRFNCRLKSRLVGRAAMSIDGTCRIGLFTQRITAKVSQHGQSYRGTFLDGAEGKGMDITSGRMGANKLTVAINSKGLTGAIVANLVRRDHMRVSISVRVSSGRYVPVVGIDLQKSRG